jgi:apolipoprotein N-acyltransferase
VYDTVRNGAQILVVQSNNSTYTGTAQPRQQFQITRVRAMEMRREIVVSTTSSFSGLIDPQGRVLAKTQEATAAAQTFTVPLRTGVSMGIRMGPALEWALSAVGLAAMVVAAMQAIRRRQPVRD